MGAGEGFGYICAEGAARKRLVMSQRRYEGACNRIADANVTFCERGGAVKRVTDFLCNKKSEWSKVHSDVVRLMRFERMTFRVGG